MARSRSSTTAPPGTWIDSRAVEEGARAAGAEIRRRHVELAPEEAIAGNEAWPPTGRRSAASRPRLDDLEWADAYVFGSPTRFGNVAAQLKQFLDQAAGCGRGQARGQGRIGLHQRRARTAARRRR